jgi:hypothetical protein
MTDTNVVETPPPFYLRLGFWAVVMLIIILQLGQYILLYIVQDYGAHDEIVSAVSFGGTLLSIGVGIIAILLTLFLALGQQRDSETVAREAMKLERVVNQAITTSNGLTERLRKLDDVSEKIDQQAAHIISAREASERTEKYYQGLAQLREPGSSDAPSPLRLSENQIGQFIQALQPIELLLLVWTYNHLPQRVKNTRKHYIDLAVSFNSEIPRDSSVEESDFGVGMFFAHLVVWTRLGFFQKTDGERSLRPGVEPALRGRVEQWEGGDRFKLEYMNTIMRRLLPLSPMKAVDP